MINKIKSISVSIATCSYLVTESVCVCVRVCVCLCVCVSVCFENSYDLLSWEISMYDTVLLTTDTRIILIEKIPRIYSSDE